MTSETTALNETTLQLGPLKIENFASLLEELRAAVNDFQTEATPEKFATIITALRGFGLSGADLWQQAASYTKRNPMRVAMIAGLAFYALKGLVDAGNSTARKMVH